MHLAIRWEQELVLPGVAWVLCSLIVWNSRALQMEHGGIHFGHLVYSPDAINVTLGNRCHLGRYK